MTNAELFMLGVLYRAGRIEEALWVLVFLVSLGLVVSLWRLLLSLRAVPLVVMPRPVEPFGGSRYGWPRVEQTDHRGAQAIYSPDDNKKWYR
jgi:hypothetical protein